MNRDPVASFTADPVVGFAPLLVYFDATASSDPDGDNLAYYWDFEGKNLIGFPGSSTATYTYERPGEYWAELLVEDEHGETSEADRLIVVRAPPGPGEGDEENQAPIAVITASENSGEAPLSIIFNAAASHDTDGSITAYYWDFGDGTVAYSPIMLHTYTAPGTYAVTLEVLDDKGATGSTSTDVTVVPAGSLMPNVPPQAVFTAIPALGWSPLLVKFDASASFDVDGMIASWQWDFGDGSPLQWGDQATHEYYAPGDYTAVLTVSDYGGATDSASKLIQVLIASPL
ncbi:PKD domain-containing protein [Candidatus Bipolaricaulota bacterium]